MYTINSAQWGNEDKTSAVVFTTEAGAVAISLIDTPEMWAAFQEFQKTNPVADMPIFPSTRTMTPKDKLEKRLGLTVAEIKALING